MPSFAKITVFDKWKP